MKLFKRNINGVNLFAYYRDRQNDSLLARSVINGDMDSFMFLIKESKLINVKNNCNETPLHLCAEFNRVDMTVELIKNGAYTEYKNYLGWTPLFQSLLSGSYEVFSLILNTKYFLAYDQSVGKIIPFEHYFNPYVKDIYGYTIAHYAYINKDKRYLKDIINKLREYKMFYLVKDVLNWQDSSFLKLYDGDSFKEEQYELNKDAFKYDLNR